MRIFGPGKLIKVFAANVEKASRKKLSADLEHHRPGSFPLISADTFRSLANRVIDEDGLLTVQRRSETDVTYLDMRFFQRGPSTVRLSSIPGLSQAMLARTDNYKVLVISNADIPPSDAQLDELSRHFDHVYCTNIRDETEKVSGIPVGIENLYRLVNGLPWNFMTGGPLSEPESRSEEIFACFSVSTNRQERTRLRNAIADSRHDYCGNRLTPLEFQSRLANAKFVLSPPGNGPDCHRTWESIYMGAVPVVLKRTLPESFVRNLPILEVEDYRWLLDLPGAELNAEYLRTREKPLERAFMPFWVRKICAAPKEGS